MAPAGRSGPGPSVVPITQLRRNAAHLIERVNRSSAPLFVTQRGYVTAVLLSHAEYDRLLAEQGASREKDWATTSASDRYLGWRTGPGVRAGSGGDEGCRRPVWTQYGRCNYETALMLAEEGVPTELVMTEDGWALDDDG